MEKRILDGKELKLHLASHIEGFSKDGIYPCDKEHHVQARKILCLH
jgi:hypothetical protein